MLQLMGAWSAILADGFPKEGRSHSNAGSLFQQYLNASVSSTLPCTSRSWPLGMCCLCLRLPLFTMLASPVAHEKSTWYTHPHMLAETIRTLGQQTTMVYSVRSMAQVSFNCTSRQACRQAWGGGRDLSHGLEHLGGDSGGQHGDTGRVIIRVVPPPAAPHPVRQQDANLIATEGAPHPCITRTIRQCNPRQPGCC